ncbi:PAS domain S-box protein [Geitlerinema splendidum]|nr:PAS domain S-box protein [Geitlerinema splendidum]
MKNLQRFESFLESMPAAVALFDCQMRYLLASRRWLDELGIETEHWVGRSHRECCPQGIALNPDYLERSLAGTSEIWTEELTPDGTTIEWESQPWIAETGDIGGIIVKRQIDRTPWAKHIENRLHLLERAIAASPDGIVISDANAPDCPLIYVNPGFENITGYTASEIIGLNCRFLQGEDRQQPELEQLRNAVRTGQECCLTLRNYRRDGSLFWNELRIAPVRDEGGNLTHFIGVQRDITERKRAEELERQSQVLRHSEIKNRALINAIPDLIFRLEENRRLVDVKAEKNRHNASESLAQPIEEVFPVEVAQKYLEKAAQALQTGEIQIFEYELCLYGNLCNYEARVVVDGLQEVLVIVRDITERKKVERLKNEFVSIVSHELRTPLTSVRGALSLITGGVVGAIPPEAQAMVDIAYKNSERLILLINDILDIEKIESGKMNFHFILMDLVPLVEQAIVSNRTYAEQFGVKFVLESEVAQARVNVDRDRLMQVLTNLLSNAAKFSPENSTVIVKIERSYPQWLPSEASESDHSSIQCVATPLQYVRISVCDRGPGIPESFRSQIFQKFAQADTSDTRRQTGTGLGLSICKAIVERLNGYINFDTQENVGTIFYVDLPEYALTPVAATQSLASNAPEELRKRLKQSQLKNQPILICEDDPDIAQLLGMMLQQDGFSTDIAYNAAEAKTLLAQKPYAAMTIDLSLPGQSGISLIRELREQEQTRSLPLIVVSATAQQGREQLQGFGFAIVDWLNKPIDRDLLATAIRQAVTRQAVNKPQILHVEDDLDLTRVIVAIVQDSAELDKAVNLQEARQKLAQNDYALVILDLSLPDGSGLELLPYLNELACPIPVLIFSAKEVNQETTHQVAAVLVKSRTSNQQLLDTIHSLIACQS